MIWYDELCQMLIAEGTTAEVIGEGVRIVLPHSTLEITLNLQLRRSGSALFSVSVVGDPGRAWVHESLWDAIKGAVPREDRSFIQTVLTKIMSSLDW